MNKELFNKKIRIGALLMLLCATHVSCGKGTSLLGVTAKWALHDGGPLLANGAIETAPGKDVFIVRLPRFTDPSVTGEKLEIQWDYTPAEYQYVEEITELGYSEEWVYWKIQPLVEDKPQGTGFVRVTGTFAGGLQTTQAIPWQNNG